MRLGRQYMVDGVCLSQTGVSQIKALQLRMPDRPPRSRGRGRGVRGLGRGHPAISRLLSPDAENDDFDHAKLAAEFYDDDGDDVTSALEKIEAGIPPSLTYMKGRGGRGRARIRVGMGIGGFMTRPRHRIFQQKKTIAGMMRGEAPAGKMEEEEDFPAFGADGKKRPRKKRGGKVRSALEDCFPSYLQARSHTLLCD